MLKLVCCISIFITHSPSIQNMKKTPNKTKKQFLFYINIFDPHLIKTPPPPLLILDTFFGPCPTIGSLPRLTHTQTHKHTNTHTNTYTHTHTHTHLFGTEEYVFQNRSVLCNPGAGWRNEMSGFWFEVQLRPFVIACDRW